MKIIFTFARMNPPTRGHARIVERMRQESSLGVNPRLYLSLTQDEIKNPLGPVEKLSFAKQLFPDIEVRLAKDVFAAGLDMAADGYDEAIMVVGEDRFETFSKTLEKYAGSEFLGLKTARAVSIDRGAEEASASQARLAVSNGDYEAFEKLSATTDKLLNHNLYEAVCFGMEANASI